MRTDEKPTLESIKNSPKMAEKSFRPSDFLTDEEMDALHESNARGGKIDKPFDDVDAFEGEILARFGWDTYQAYLSGEIDINQLAKFVAAERARDAQNRYNLECIIVSSVAGANRPQNHRAPESLKKAVEIIKKEYKRAKGEQ